jgi:hypothetical protein
VSSSPLATSKKRSNCSIIPSLHKEYTLLKCAPIQTAQKSSWSRFFYSINAAVLLTCTPAQVCVHGNSRPRPADVCKTTISKELQGCPLTQPTSVEALQ